MAFTNKSTQCDGLGWAMDWAAIRMPPSAEERPAKQSSADHLFKCALANRLGKSALEVTT